MREFQGLFDLLDAEAEMSRALFYMQDDIRMGHYKDAMGAQFEYLYLRDKWESLFYENSDEYFELLKMAKGQS